MKLNAIDVYKNMFFVLDEIWAKNKDEMLSIFLSEADPTLCQEGSADPIVYEDFLKFCPKEIETNDFGYEYILNYLSNLDSYYGDIKSFFLTISKESFVDKCKTFLNY